MPRSSERLAVSMTAMLVLAIASAAPSDTRPTALGRLSYAEPGAELAAGGAAWRQVPEGVEISTGDAVRVGGGAVARIELPWMALTLTSGARLRFSDGLLLAAFLESGRVLAEAETSEVMKLVAGDSEIRGRGRLIVRREGHTALVSCLAGRFRIVSPAGAVSLETGVGSIVRSGRAPSAPTPIPEAPDGLWPGDDPLYVTRRELLELRWRGVASRYDVELLPVGAEIVLLHREVDRPTLEIGIPWVGAFRWRVSARDGNGLEGAPSREGLIAVE